MEDDIGAPHPPEISFGVIREGTLPSSTLEGAGLGGDGSGAPHAFVSAPQGSLNADALGWELITGLAAGAGFGADCVADDKLKTELGIADDCVC